ncbi:antitoxin [Microbacterium karelineae]|uniref:antitoxin n=1 Tax=Microbacterium karelineae TaxID=2654283 RepID=UPI0012EACA68|nr:antitoxin [Microbacterium karelineae]
MRTTVTLDPDVERALRERMAREHVSFKRALNDAVRDSARDRGDIGTPFHTPVFDLGQPTTDLTKANSIAAGLDDEDIAKHLRA